MRVNLFRLLENNMVLKALFDSLSEFTELDKIDGPRSLEGLCRQMRLPELGLPLRHVEVHEGPEDSRVPWFLESQNSYGRFVLLLLLLVLLLLLLLLRLLLVASYVCSSCGVPEVRSTWSISRWKRGKAEVPRHHFCSNSAI